MTSTAHFLHMKNEIILNWDRLNRLPETKLLGNRSLVVENRIPELAGGIDNSKTYAVFLCYTIFICHHGIDKLKNSTDHVGGRLEQNPGLGDDTELPEPAEGSEEELGVIVL